MQRAYYPNIYNTYANRSAVQRPNDIDLSDINQNQVPVPRESEQMPLSGAQSTSQNPTPRAIQTISAYN